MTLEARLDRLPWSPLHTTILVALGAGWLFDSLEVQLFGNAVGPLGQHFHASVTQQDAILAVWLSGILLGAMAGGRLTDRFGRRRLFVATLCWYAVFTMLTGASPALGFVYAFRFLAALGVGAEYAIVNAAIAELIPARVRGKASALVMNFWPAGAIVAGLVAYLVPDTLALPDTTSWRYLFLAGGLIALVVLYFRRRIPESPRWLLSRGRAAEAEAIVAALEERSGIAGAASGSAGPAVRAPLGTRQALGELLHRYPGRLALGALLDLAEAFGYYGLFALLSVVVLPAVHISSGEIPFFYIIGNAGGLAGGLAMSAVFDRLGRHRTVTMFYALATTSRSFARWMGNLPTWRRETIAGADVHFVHGSPLALNDFWWESLPGDQHRLRAAASGADVICCTHSGLPWQRRVGSSLVVNVGVLGKPANDGRREVWYAILDLRDGAAAAELVPLAYDWRAQAASMRAAGLPEIFAETIETGWWTTCLEVLPPAERSRGRFHLYRSTLPAGFTPAGDGWGTAATTGDPDIVNLLDAATAALPTVVLTNAMLLRGRRAAGLERLAGRKLTFQTSLDGARPGPHDRHRGQGSFTRTLDGIRRLTELGFTRGSRSPKRERTAPRSPRSPDCWTTWASRRPISRSGRCCGAGSPLAAPRSPRPPASQSSPSPQTGCTGTPPGPTLPPAPTCTSPRPAPRWPRASASSPGASSRPASPAAPCPVPSAARSSSPPQPGCGHVNLPPAEMPKGPCGWSAGRATGVPRGRECQRGDTMVA